MDGRVTTFSRLDVSITVTFARHRTRGAQTPENRLTQPADENKHSDGINAPFNYLNRSTTNCTRSIGRKREEVVTVYIIALSLLFILSLMSFDAHLNRIQQWRYLVGIFAGIFVIAFVGPRNNIGGDWPNYSAMVKLFHWSTVLRVYIFHPIEPSYVALILLSNTFGGGLYLVNTLAAAIAVFCFIWYSRLMALNPAYILFLAAPYLLFVAAMDYGRQIIAISIGFVALAYLCNGRRRTFYWLVWIAASFHFSALVLFSFTRFKRPLYAVLLLAVGGIGLFIIHLKYENYLKGNDHFNSKGVWLRLGILLVGAILFYVQKKYWSQSPPAYEVMKRCTLIIFLLVLISPHFSTIADRLGLYFMFLYITCAASIFKTSSYASQPLGLSFTTLMSYGTLLVWFGFSPGARLWIPYNSFLFGKF